MRKELGLKENAVKEAWEALNEADIALLEAKVAFRKAEIAHEKAQRERDEIYLRGEPKMES